jgi:hypothetical protein
VTTGFPRGIPQLALLLDQTEFQDVIESRHADEAPIRRSQQSLVDLVEIRYQRGATSQRLRKRPSARFSATPICLP